MTIYVWTDSLWVTDNNSPIILLFGRNYHDKTITKTFTIRGFNPYFYAPSTVSTGLIDALGRPIKKVIARFPSDIPRLRERFEWTDEADILFDKRFLIDNKISYAFTEDDIKPVDVPSPIDPRVLWIDIEILGKSIPNPAHPSYPIVSIQLMDSYTKEITIFTYQIPKCDDVQVCCKSEHELLVRFVNYVHQLDPDIISGWNSNEFDLPYIINRAKTLGVSLIEMCRIYREPSARNIGGRWNIKVHGRQCFDFLEAFRKYYAPQGQLDSYRLKSVISNRDIMGDDAYSYEDQGGNLISLFENERWSEIILYCKNDVVALDTINNKIKLIEFFEGLRMISGVKIEETLANSRVIESIIMRAGIRPVPTKHTLPTSPDGYEGAIVLSPPIGIHDNVGVIDLTSLYPNIMVGFNISPDIDGVIPNTLRIIMEERDKIRKLRLEGKADDVMVNKETVLKYLANSFYGVIGWPQFRLYDKEQASKVTRIGREINIFLRSVVEESGYTVLYSDTDSCLFSPVNSPDDGIEFSKYCNERLAEWSKSKNSMITFTVKFEKLYRRILFKKSSTNIAAKKRYAGHLVWKDGFKTDKLDSTGIELRRSDQARITKQLLDNFLTNVLLYDNPSTAINELKTTIKKIKNGDISVHDLGIPRGINTTERTNPWIRGCQATQELLGITIPSDVKPRLIYIKNSPGELCIYDDIPEDLIRSRVDIDWSTCMHNAVEKKLRTFVESIGLNWDQVIGGQQTLF